jgi:hypothetical protein
MTMHDTTLLVDAHVVQKMNRILNGPCVEDTKHDATIQVFTTSFPNGVEADIKVCNGDSSPWIDAVLFDQDGNEIALQEPSGWPLNRDWEWEDDGEKYVLHLAAP